ncbi:hypothetical protein F4775DRAFT_67773 [Biscogniauxia sp. FL1348]|nr:hypothetical protein F4775DRAFT_67773 [Biscogniauxia sp. FL1348]
MFFQLNKYRAKCGPQIGLLLLAYGLCKARAKALNPDVSFAALAKLYLLQYGKVAGERHRYLTWGKKNTPYTM